MTFFSKQDERKLLEAGRHFFSTAFPNPNREGCPGQDILRAIAFRKLERQKAKEWDDHLSHCSPCFNEYMAFREQARRSAKVRMVAVAAAAAIVVIVGAIWLVYRSLGPRPNTKVTYQANLLDLRERAALRGPEANPSGAPIELPRRALALSIYLPTGSVPGKYEVEIVEQPGKPLIGAEGAAVLRNHIALLDVKVDLQRLRPGLYLVGIRQAGWSWAYYPVVLK
jgi:hypothetical protein